MSEENQGVEVSKQILKEEKKQNRKEGIQTVGITIMTICMVIITVVAVSVFVNINRKINAFYTKADTAITSLNEIATDIQEADLPGMATKIDELTENAADGVATTMEKIDSINIDELNEAISSLDAAVEALRATAEGFAGIFGH
ncbi:MAG: hypothetical protein IKH76_03110 [Clostridiales bacterium]|jgi:t-SNARE complex subunit (syntaxin)|nr:hypothetical protein [Clostridiales bacterium]MBR6959448.1 hypothetical protein [Clostridiales bacterium]